VVMFDRLKKKSAGSKDAPAPTPGAKPAPQQFNTPEAGAEWKF